MYPHVHKYKFESATANNHKHNIIGRTDSMMGFGALHFHYFCGVCCHNGHSHYYSGITSLPTKTENGHVHKIEGILEINNLHEHAFSSYTFEEIEYTKGRWSFYYRRLATGNS